MSVEAVLTPYQCGGGGDTVVSTDGASYSAEHHGEAFGRQLADGQQVVSKFRDQEGVVDAKESGLTVA